MEELRKIIEEYREKHPEVEEIMRKFQVSKETYEKALAAMSIKVKAIRPTYAKTTEGSYNANVSGTAR